MNLIAGLIGLISAGKPLPDIDLRNPPRGGTGGERRSTLTKAQRADRKWRNKRARAARRLNRR